MQSMMMLDMMSLVTLLSVLWTCVFIPLTEGGALSYGSKYYYPYNRCFECSYHYGKSTYLQCRNPGIEEGVSASPCPGKCFMRRDANGYVYRGCASQTNYPNLKLYARGCNFQGHPRSLWWLCEGDLCNHGDLMDTCQENDYPLPKPFNICDGTCRHPSGLYPDPQSPEYYIQCGFDLIQKRACPCCKQYHMKCPDNTEWNDRLKQCTTPYHQLRPLFGEGYGYGYN